MARMEPAPSFSSAASAARCANHPELAAVVVCARCGAFACASCHQVATDGRPYCGRCLAMSDQRPLADRGTRFVANLIDRLAILLIMFVFVFVAILADAAASGGKPSEDPPLWLLAAIVLVPLAWFGVQLYMQVTYGQSIGKRMLGIRVVRMDGSPVSVARIVFLRNVVPEMISGGCSLFGLVDALLIFSADQRCVHDLLSDTKVVRVR